MNLSTINKQFWSFGIFWGLSTSFLTTLVILTWELIENPGGIYFGESGLNWMFVFDLSVSWLVPTFVYAALILATFHLVGSLIKSLVNKYRMNN